MVKKIVHEENPWPDLQGFNIADFEVVEDFLPSPEVLRNTRAQADTNSTLLVPVTKKDMRVLQRRAKSKGISSQALAAAVLHAFADHAS